MFAIIVELNEIIPGVVSRRQKISKLGSMLGATTVAFVSYALLKSVLIARHTRTWPGR